LNTDPVPDPIRI
jgi:hypothetical protein